MLLKSKLFYWFKPVEKGVIYLHTYVLSIPIETLILVFDLSCNQPQTFKTKPRNVFSFNPTRFINYLYI